MKGLVDNIAGYLEVGRKDFEVVVNLDHDRNGVGHIVFSPNQARALAKLLLKCAKEAEAAYWSKAQGKKTKR